MRATFEAKFKLLYQIIQNIVVRQIFTTHVFHIFLPCILNDTLRSLFVRSERYERNHVDKLSSYNNAYYNILTYSLFMNRG